MAKAKKKEEMKRKNEDINIWHNKIKEDFHLLFIIIIISSGIQAFKGLLCVLIKEEEGNSRQIML